MPTLSVNPILVKACPRGRGFGGRGNYTARPGMGRAQVNFCSTLGPVHSCDVGVQCCRDVDNESSWVFSENRVVEAIGTSKVILGVKASPLELLKVDVEGIACKALRDSGAQIPVISQCLYEQCTTEVIGKIGLQPVVGHVVDVLLVNVSLRLCNESDAYLIKSDLPLVCAVADINATDYDVILPSDVDRELHDLPVVEVRKPVLSVNDAAVVEDYSMLSSDVDSVDKTTNNVADCDVDTFI